MITLARIICLGQRRQSLSNIVIVRVQIVHATSSLPSPRLPSFLLLLSSISPSPYILPSFFSPFPLPLEVGPFTPATERSLGALLAPQWGLERSPSRQRF